ncbi:MAG: DUF1206 domain-containing protein [Gaiellaceae bacterium]
MAWDTTLDAAAAGRSAKRAARAPWVEWLARFGMVAQGFLYGVVAVLAIRLALDHGGETTDQRGALRTLASEGFGKWLLVLLAIGLAGYALWRFVVAALGEKVEHGEDVGAGKRLVYAARGLVYASLCWTAVSIVLDAGGSGGGSKEDKAAAVVLGWPGGVALVAAVGLGVLCYGLWNVYKGLSCRFLKDMKTEEMNDTGRRWIRRTGLVGHVARGIVFGLIGVFLVKAALEYDPDEAIGLDGALQELASQSYGDAWLGLVAAGLLAYGVYCLARARYREV